MQNWLNSGPNYQLSTPQLLSLARHTSLIPTLSVSNRTTALSKTDLSTTKVVLSPLVTSDCLYIEFVGVTIVVDIISHFDIMRNLYLLPKRYL